MLTTQAVDHALYHAMCREKRDYTIFMNVDNPSHTGFVIQLKPPKMARKFVTLLHPGHFTWYQGQCSIAVV